MDMSIRFPGIQLTLDYVGKSIHIFGFEITIYGILIAVGMLLGIAFIVLEAKRSNQNQNLYLDMVILALIFGVIGARLYYVSCTWSLYKGNILEIINTRNGGMAIYGGILGGTLAAGVFCRIKKLPFGQMADTASMGLLIGQIIGRWGNFFNRESFGEYTDQVFAMQLPLSAVRSGEVTAGMRENLVTVEGVSYIQVHPVFLYESLLCLLLFLFLLARRRKKRFQGEIFMRYLAGYGLIRFFMELLRSDKLLIPGTGIPISLAVSAILFIVFQIIITIRCIMAKKREATRRRRREERYEAEERAAAREEKPEQKQAESEALVNEQNVHEEEGPDAMETGTVLPDADAAEAAEPQNSGQEGSSEESEDQPKA